MGLQSRESATKFFDAIAASAFSMSLVPMPPVMVNSVPVAPKDYLFPRWTSLQRWL